MSKNMGNVALRNSEKERGKKKNKTIQGNCELGNKQRTHRFHSYFIEYSFPGTFDRNGSSDTIQAGDTSSYIQHLSFSYVMP